jgi:hypothetical protein
MTTIVVTLDHDQGRRTAANSFGFFLRIGLMGGLVMLLLACKARASAKIRLVALTELLQLNPLAKLAER